MPYDEEIPPYADLPEPPPELDRLARAVIGAAIEVHRELGPGLPEDVNVSALCLELTARGLSYEREKRVEVHYKGQLVGYGKIDLLVEGKLVVEAKSCERLSPVHRLQTLTYMRIIKQPLGLLINFNVPVLKEGIRRIISS